MFVEKSRKGEILGNIVYAKPVPFALAIACIKASDDAARLEALAAVVRECVKDDSGSAINPDELSTNAVAELGAFAIGGSGELTDFI